MRKIAREKTERLYLDRMQASIAEAAEDALSEFFETGFESLKGDLKNNSYISIEHGLAKMDHIEALDAPLDQSIERWTQSSVFVDVLHIEP